MTAVQKAVALLSERGHMTPGEFAKIAWPHLWASAPDKRKVEADAGIFLTRLAKQRRVRKVGRRYGV